MEIVVFILIVVGCVLCHKLSTSYNDRVKEKYCMGCINWWWSAVIAVLLAATMLTIGEQIFWIFIVLTLCSALLSAWLAYRQMINWGASSKEAYIIPLLFFKRISDVYDEETENVKKQYGEAAAFFFKEEDIHTFVIPDGCHWQDVRNVSENVGIAIINAMTGIESANGKKLQGVFSSFDDADWANKNKLSDEVLKDLIEHLSAIHVGNGDYSADVMGDSYEYLIKQFAEIAKKTGGEFYTPRAVVKLLVKILDPKAGDTVYEIIMQTMIQGIGKIKKYAFAV